MLSTIASSAVFFILLLGVPVLIIWLTYEPDPNPRLDTAGRKIHGARVQLDFFPFRYLLPIVLVWAISAIVPSLVTIIAVLSIAGALLYNLTALRHPDYHLNKDQR